MRSALFEVGTLQLPLWSNEESAEHWNIRESARARRLSVRILRGGRVEVVVPRRTSRRRVASFLDRHRNWIETRQAEARRNAAPAEPFPPQQIALSAFNEIYRPPSTGRKQMTRQALRRWLMRKAAETLAPMLAATAQELNLNYKKAVIRRQHTRWGSCSTRGTISLNCCLLFQRPEVVRYLLIHELAHTQHMNHSKRFWECVARYCTDYEALDRELLNGWRRVPSWVFDL